MQAYHTDKVRLLVSSVLSQTIEDARAGCHDAWEWANSDKAVEWAGALGMDSIWLTTCQALKEPPGGASLFPKPEPRANIEYVPPLPSPVYHWPVRSLSLYQSLPTKISPKKPKKAKRLPNGLTEKQAANWVRLD